MRAPRACARRQASIQLVERELRAIVARVEPLGAQIDRVGAIRDRGPHGVERAGRRERAREQGAEA